MTREQKDNWARVCANLTDDLPSKINSIGNALVKCMATANQKNLYSDFYVDGMINTLLVLGVPCQAHKDGDAYHAVEIAGEMFRVNDSSEADADNSGQEGE